MAAWAGESTYTARRPSTLSLYYPIHTISPPPLPCALTPAAGAVMQNQSAADVSLPPICMFMLRAFLACTQSRNDACMLCES